MWLTRSISFSSVTGLKLGPYISTAAFLHSKVSCNGAEQPITKGITTSNKCIATSSFLLLVVMHSNALVTSSDVINSARYTTGEMAKTEQAAAAFEHHDCVAD